MNRIIEMFKELGFKYSTFWTDAGDRDIFTHVDTGKQIIFYEEEGDDGHGYHIDNGLVIVKLHNAISAYIEYKGW